jgi:hypothetical protein
MVPQQPEMFWLAVMAVSPSRFRLKKQEDQLSMIPAHGIVREVILPPGKAELELCNHTAVVRFPRRKRCSVADETRISQILSLPSKPNLFAAYTILTSR